MVSNYISLDRIIEKINRLKIPGGYWNIEELKEWSYDALDAINDKYAKVKNTKLIEIINNKAKLPADIQTIYTIFDNDENKLEEVLPYDDLEKSTYSLNAGYIYTNFDSGYNRLTINYSTVPLGEDGNPLIPDNRYYISAIEAYLHYMIAKRAFIQGKILQNQFQMLEQEWYICLPAATASQKLDILKDPSRFSKIHNKFMH